MDNWIETETGWEYVEDAVSLPHDDGETDHEYSVIPPDMFEEYAGGY